MTKCTNVATVSELHRMTAKKNIQREESANRIEGHKRH